MLALPSLLWELGGSASPAGRVLGSVLHFWGPALWEGLLGHTWPCCQGTKEPSIAGKRSLLYCLFQLPPKHHLVSGSLVLYSFVSEA